MEKRRSSRAVIIEDNKLLYIFRRKIDDLGNISEYYVIPGGGIEDNETKEETVVRELKEELDRMTLNNYYEPMFKDVKELKNLDFSGMDLVNKALNKEYVSDIEKLQKLIDESSNMVVYI